eukprot:753889-Hanusia_phi.AAC.3
MISKCITANVSEDEVALGEQAAQTILTLITNSRDNLVSILCEYLVQQVSSNVYKELAQHHRAVETMADALLKSPAPLLQMWSAAALQKVSTFDTN